MIYLLWTVQLLFNLLIVLCLIVYIYTGDRKNRKKVKDNPNSEDSFYQIRELAGAFDELINAYDEKSREALESIYLKHKEIEDQINKVKDIEKSICNSMNTIQNSSFQKEEEHKSSIELKFDPEKDKAVKKNLPTGKYDRIPSLPRYREVLILSEQGVSEEQIARQIDIGIGEVRLVLDLQKRKTVIPGNMKGNVNHVKRRL